MDTPIYIKIAALLMLFILTLMCVAILMSVMFVGLTGYVTDSLSKRLQLGE